MMFVVSVKVLVVSNSMIANPNKFLPTLSYKVLVICLHRGSDLTYLQLPKHRGYVFACVCDLFLDCLISYNFCSSIIVPMSEIETRRSHLS